MTHHVKTTDYSTLSAQRVVPAARVPHPAPAAMPELAPELAPVDALAALEAALGRRDIQGARTAIAQAETDGVLTEGALALGKARIAFADGDIEATKAILVMAIERAPESPALRSMLTEVMVATGSAGEARAVLAHLGQAPVNPPKNPLARPEAQPEARPVRRLRRAEESPLAV